MVKSLSTEQQAQLLTGSHSDFAALIKALSLSSSLCAHFEDEDGDLIALRDKDDLAVWRAECLGKKALKLTLK